jgi:PAS domain S-box-containing protein
LLAVAARQLLQGRHPSPVAGEDSVPEDQLQRLYELSMRFAETRQELDDLLNRAPVPAITLDADGKVETWNRAAAEQLGWKAGDVIGRKLALQTPGLGAVWEVLEPHARRAAEVLDFEIEVLDRRGRPLLGSLTLVPAADPDWRSLVLTLRAVQN